MKKIVLFLFIFTVLWFVKWIRYNPIYRAERPTSIEIQFIEIKDNGVATIPMTTFYPIARVKAAEKVILKNIDSINLIVNEAKRMKREPVYSFRDSFISGNIICNFIYDKDTVVCSGTIMHVMHSEVDSFKVDNLFLDYLEFTKGEAFVSLLIEAYSSKKN